MREQEADLVHLELLTNDLQMQYIPKKKRKSDCFELRSEIKMPSGHKDVQIFAVNTKWVRDSFEMEFVYALVKKALKCGYLDVTREKKLIFDKKPIIKIKAYMNENEDLCYKGIPNGTTFGVDLPLPWVEQNLDEEFIKKLKEEMQKDRFIPVPKGAPKTHDWHDKFDQDAPKLHYMQGENVYYLPYSFASALHYKGFKLLANQISQNKHKICNAPNPWLIIDPIVRDKIRWMACKQIKNGLFDPFRDTNEWPTILVLEGEDGSRNHAVTKVGEWIFDSNLPFAVKLSRLFFDWCVSTPEVKGKYKNVHFALQLLQRDSKNRKRENMQSRSDYARSKKQKKSP